MQGRLENQIKTEKKIQNLLKDMSVEVEEYYINFSANKEFRSCLIYIQKIKKFLLWYSSENNIDIKKIDYRVITDTDISKYLKEVEFKQTKNGMEYTSFSYRKQIWSTLNSFFSFLDKKRYIESNPVRLIERPTKKDKVNHVFLNKKDLDSIIETVTFGAGTNHAIKCQEKWRERDLAILYTFIFTGMRDSALCEIDLDRIDLENNILEVTDKEHKVNTYTIPQKLKSVIIAWMKKREELLGDVQSDALFISSQRKRIEQNTVRTIIQKYSQEALGYKVSPHRLRAAYGNIIFKSTNDINFTSRAMKHSNIETTRIYLESDEAEINNQVADIMENAF